MDNYVICNGELYHHGIKGMKWGVRRFQKKNGSLTPAGKKRQKENWSDDANEASKIKKKSVKEMSNAELRRLNERTRLEQEYSRLNPSTRKKAIAAVTATAATMGTLLNLYNNSDKLIAKGKPIAQKLIKPISEKFKKEMVIGLWSDIHSDELYHYGVKGMKWGVKRYRNFAGSYTQAGVKRFDKSLSKFEKANDRYKTAKKSGSSKIEITNARLAKKQAKQRLNKDYKHLKQDKLGDQGKDLYSRGVTITGNDKVTRALGSIGGLSLTLAFANHNYGTLGGSPTVTKALAGVGGAYMTTATIKQTIDYSRNKKLRAYYSHTSNY